MVIVLLLSVVPSQYCRELGPDARVLCNKMHEMSGKLDKSTGEHSLALRRQDNHQLRIENLEYKIQDQSIEIREFSTYKNEATGERRMELALATFATAFLMAWVNRSWAKFDKRNGRS